LDVAQLHACWADKLARTLGVSLASVAPPVWHAATGRAVAPAHGAEGAVIGELELARPAQKAVALAQQEIGILAAIWVVAALTAAELAVLAEMTADDAAARCHDPADLAAALVTLASAGISTTALTAGGPAAITRIQRLLAPPAPPGLPVRAGRLAAGLAALMIPVVITSIPLAIAACDIITRA
jgi:bla regulator protein blaR1